MDICHNCLKNGELRGLDISLQSSCLGGFTKTRRILCLMRLQNRTTIISRLWWIILRAQNGLKLFYNSSGNFSKFKRKFWFNIDRLRREQKRLHLLSQAAKMSFQEHYQRHLKATFSKPSPLLLNNMQIVTSTPISFEQAYQSSSSPQERAYFKSKDRCLNEQQKI